MPALEELGEYLAEVYLDVQAHPGYGDCPIDDHFTIFDRWAGIDSLYDEVIGAADTIACAVGESIRTDPPDWYLDVRAARLPEPTTTEEVQS